MAQGYLFRVSDHRQGGAGTYTETYYNNPNGQYWKTVSEAQRIIEAKVPRGATVSYMGYA